MGWKRVRTGARRNGLCWATSQYLLAVLGLRHVKGSDVTYSRNISKVYERSYGISIQFLIDIHLYESDSMPCRSATPSATKLQS